MMISKKVVVIGAGAAGLMAGATAALYGASEMCIRDRCISYDNRKEQACRQENYDNGQRKV